MKLTSKGDDELLEYGERLQDLSVSVGLSGYLEDPETDKELDTLLDELERVTVKLETLLKFVEEN